jgi:hypothetical protein
VRALREWIRPRSFQFTNRARLDRLPMLLHLHIDGYANERVYSAAIRDWLLSTAGAHGWPVGPSPTPTAPPRSEPHAKAPIGDRVAFSRAAEGIRTLDLVHGNH